MNAFAHIPVILLNTDTFWSPALPSLNHLPTPAAAQVRREKVSISSWPEISGTNDSASIGGYNTLAWAYTHPNSTNGSCMADCYYIVAHEAPLFSIVLDLYCLNFTENRLWMSLYFFLQSRTGIEKLRTISISIEIHGSLNYRFKRTVCLDSHARQSRKRSSGRTLLIKEVWVS